MVPTKPKYIAHTERVRRRSRGVFNAQRGAQNHLSEPIQHGTIYIEDANHAEMEGPFESFDAAISELRRRAEIAWETPPNRAPCTSWPSCGREYFVLEYAPGDDASRLIRKAHVLDVSAVGVTWVQGFEEAWAQATT